MKMSDPNHPVLPPLHPSGFAKWCWQLLKDVVNEYRRDGVGDLAAAITFWTLLSVPAAVLALVSAMSSLERFIGTSAADDLETEVQDFISRTFADSQTLGNAVSELFQDTSGGVVTAATAVAVFSLSRGFAGLIRALDRAYEVTDGRSWWHIRLVALGMGIGSVVVIAGSAVLFAVLPDLPLGPVLSIVIRPLTVALVVVWAATLFHLGPYHRTPWRYDLPGAFLTTAGWLLASQGFVYYVRVAGRGNQVQTAVGAVLLGLTLLYMLAIVMLVGAELNDVLTRRAGVVQQPVRPKERYGQVVDALSERRSANGDGDQGVDP
nr:hypothetical protein [uncultured bacterium]